MTQVTLLKPAAAAQIVLDAQSARSASEVASSAASVASASAAADRALTQAARDAAFINADVFADIATGRAAVADGGQFQVVTGDQIIRYRRDSSSAQTEVARYPAAQAIVALLGAVGQIASMIGQIGDQVSGGQVALAAGTIADPALRIGTVGIYSAASNTLSVVISGVERARFTAAGLTVYGTITTVP